MIEKEKLYEGQEVWWGRLDFTAGFTTTSRTLPIECYIVTRIRSNYIHLRLKRDNTIKRVISVTPYGKGFENSLYESHEDAAFDWDCKIREELDRLCVRKDAEASKILTIKNKIQDTINEKRKNKEG